MITVILFRFEIIKCFTSRFTSWWKTKYYFRVAFITQYSYMLLQLFGCMDGIFIGVIVVNAGYWY